MNGVLTFDNLNTILMPRVSDYSSNSLVDESDQIVEQAETLENKFSLLKKDVGDKLFDQLSYEQKTFIVNVSNTINLGDSVNIDVIYSDIEKLEYA